MVQAFSASCFHNEYKLRMKLECDTQHIYFTKKISLRGYAILSGKNLSHTSHFQEKPYSSQNGNTIWEVNKNRNFQITKIESSETWCRLKFCEETVTD